MFRPTCPHFRPAGYLSDLRYLDVHTDLVCASSSKVLGTERPRLFHCLLTVVVTDCQRNLPAPSGPDLEQYRVPCFSAENESSMFHSPSCARPGEPKRQEEEQGRIQARRLGFQRVRLQESPGRLQSFYNTLCNIHLNPASPPAGDLPLYLPHKWWPPFPVATRA